MAVIHILDKHTAELIAAGEVVERPASAVKELLENAIDAGATKITISIEAGGVRLIEVSDNGSGIETEYIPAAFIRHATSKIAREEDLEHIHTLGFRGEALASIASVAKVEVLTCTEQDEFAALYRIEGGVEQPIQPGARAVGTTIRVRELFYNTPARMKFLKKDSSEGTYVAEVVSHLALSHPEISFKFVREGKLQYVTPGDGSLSNTAYALLGKEFSRGLLPVDNTEAPYRVSGLVTPPKSCRASRSMQHFYINGRYVKNKTMMAAMETAFKGTVMQGKFPGGILMLEMPVELVDVNVHPAKTEVRFAREGDVFDVVYHAVKLALAQPGSGEQRFVFHAEENAPDTSSLEIREPEQMAEEPKRTEQTPASSIPEPLPHERPTGLAAVLPKQAQPGALRTAEPSASAAERDILPTMIPKDAPLKMSVSAASPVWENIRREQTPSFRLAGQESLLDIQPEVSVLPETPEVPAKMPSEESVLPSPEVENLAPELPVVEQSGQTGFFAPEPVQKLEYVGELFRTYIIAQRGDEVCLIDKHAAHERQLYEKLSANYGQVPEQLLLAPVTVNLSAEEKQAVLDNVDLLENAGIEVGDFGGSTLVLRSVPADVTPDSAEDLLVELADKLAKGSRDALSERTEWVLASVCCKAAVKAGDRSTPQELMALAEKILSGEVPPFCPHGRPCVLKLTRKELEKQFGRIV